MLVIADNVQCKTQCQCGTWRWDVTLPLEFWGTRHHNRPMTHQSFRFLGLLPLLLGMREPAERPDCPYASQCVEGQSFAILPDEQSYELVLPPPDTAVAVEPNTRLISVDFTMPIEFGSTV
jgi:hypothetical protein